MTIKAIQTKYKGYLFRSRLEARWAVYMDAMKFEWEYEREGFNMDGTLYLPDFWLPRVHMWAEVKPEAFDKEAMDKVVALVKGTKHSCILLVGVPDDRPYDYVYWDEFAVEENATWAAYLRGELDCPQIVAEFDNHRSHYDLEYPLDEFSTEDLIFSNDYYFSEKRFFSSTGCNTVEEYRFNYDTNPDITRAVTLARSARFEHGETPNPSRR